MRRTNEDKRRAVLTLLNDPDWARWSDREIARQCAVTHPFVSSLRPNTRASGKRYQMDEERVVIRNGARLLYCGRPDVQKVDGIINRETNSSVYRHAHRAAVVPSWPQ